MKTNLLTLTLRFLHESQATAARDSRRLRFEALVGAIGAEPGSDGGPDSISIIPPEI